MQIRFLSKNKYKIEEAKRILNVFDIELLATHFEIDELQTSDTKKLLRDKALKAFKHVGRPIFVEHTGLYLNLLNGFPGGLTQNFWDTLEKEKFAELFAGMEPVMARTDVCYVDGKRVWYFEGEVEGLIVKPPRVDHGFQWDCVFQPLGYEQTFSDMGRMKDQVSMRRKALEALARHIRTHYAAQ